MSQTGGHSPAPIDYDLHGLAGVRLLDASSREAAMVTRQLGPKLVIIYTTGALP